MGRSILVSGLINLETTLNVEQFPLNYVPVRYSFFGINSTVSGVGFNIAKALTTLGNSVRLLSMVGQDLPAEMILKTLKDASLDTAYVCPVLEKTPQSVIHFDSTGQRMIHVDLKAIQETSFPIDQFEQALTDCDAAILCNINFSRAFLNHPALANKWVVSDVHTIRDLEDPYNRDFMAAADILFMSDSALPCAPEDWAQAILARYAAEIVVIGLGENGALLATRQDRFMRRFPAVKLRPIVNTIGAGDALLSAFVHCYLKTHDPKEALQQAIHFAAWKIGANGGAEGFLSHDELVKLNNCAS